MFKNPGLSLRSNPGLKLANAFGITNCNTTFTGWESTEIVSRDRLIVMKGALGVLFGSFFV